jgi:hypothetical protein
MSPIHLCTGASLCETFEDLSYGTSQAGKTGRQQCVNDATLSHNYVAITNTNSFTLSFY